MKPRAAAALLALLSSVALAGGPAGAAGAPPLIAAVKARDRNAVRSLAKQTATVNTPEVDGTTALHWAVRQNDLDVVKVLLQAGANVNAANRYGVTPLQLAAVNGDAPTIELLLNAGANANTALPEGETVLMAAARTGRAEALTTLLAHGADPNAREGWLGETALIWAATENHPAAVRALLKAGARVDDRSAVLTVPDWWLKPPTLGFITIEFPRGGWTALTYAARQGALESAQALVEAGAGLNLTDPEGVTALVEAIVNAHYDVASYLLDKGADPDVADRAGMTALYAIVDMHTLPGMLARPDFIPTGPDNIEIVKKLLAQGADPNLSLKMPPLQREHMDGDPALSAGATPFMRAAKAGDVEVMRLLVAHGARPNAAQKNGTTALMLAAGLGWRDSGNGTPRGDRGSERDALAAVKLCLELGADINAANERGDSVLHGAVTGRASEPIIRWLVSHGARLDATNKLGRTPLEVAASSRRERGGTVALLRELEQQNVKRD